jgi:hypothetical protein
MDTHDDLVSIDIDMSLHEWHRLVQDIIAAADQVDVEHLVVSHYAEDTLVVVLGLLWVELDNYTRLGFRWDGSFNLREREDIGPIGEKLKRRSGITLIDDVEEPVRRRLKLNFTEVDALGRQEDVDAIGLAGASQLELISSNNGNLELRACELSNDQRFEIDGYLLRASWHNDTLVFVKSNSFIFAIIIDLLDDVLRLNL